MIINDIKISLNDLPDKCSEIDKETALIPYIQKKASKVAKRNIDRFYVVKKSVDARKKEDIKLVYSIALGDRTKSSFEEYKENKYNTRPIVVGTGPCGLFCALVLATNGAKPIVLERGPKIEDRINKIQRFWNEGILDTNGNVQFGEGGAGTFSDGKLNTGIKDENIKKVLETFVAAGAPIEILYDSKPHIGTDRLREAVINIRKRIISLGGEIRFNERLKDIVVKDGKIQSVIIEKNCDKVTDKTCYEELCSKLVLAIGHSSRDTFSMLRDRNISMEEKPFSMGVRIEHPQVLIDKAQYGKFANHWALDVADYKLSTHLSNGRGVYSFCMCPGGVVVNSSSEEGRLVTNGMSYYKRDSGFANSALLVGVEPSDFAGIDGVLSGVAYQRKYEELAYIAGGRTYKAPGTTVGNLLNNTDNKIVSSTFKPGVVLSKLDSFLPDFIVESLILALPIFDKKISGFASNDSVLVGVESRSSSPVRILRNDKFESNILGIYPAGEGAGYAGGITSAAVDGIKVANAILGEM